MKDTEQIAKVVRQTLANDFVNIKIIDVRIQEEKDSDGDDMLRVEVVFEGQPKDVDASKLAGIVRHVRPKLNEIGENAFPVFSFISQGDWGERRLKTA